MAIDDRPTRRSGAGDLTLRSVTTDEAAPEVDVGEHQRGFVAQVPVYLELCARPGSPWRPLVAEVDGEPVGFVMEGIDPDDGVFWIGGLLVDGNRQRHGYGRAIVEQLIDRARAGRHPFVSLAYRADNEVAKALYASLGFVETGEVDEDGELVARLDLT